MSKFLKGVVNIILLCAILVSAALLVPPLVGVTTAVIDEERMETNLPKGSVTYALSKDLSEISKGNSILIESGGSIYVYEVEAMDSVSGAFTLKDALNTGGNTQEKTLRNKAEKVLFTVPFIGYVAMAMKTTEGLILIGLGVVFVIILFVLAEIWKDEDDDDELSDEDDDDQPLFPKAKERQYYEKEDKTDEVILAAAEPSEDSKEAEVVSEVQEKTQETAEDAKGETEAVPVSQEALEKDFEESPEKESSAKETVEEVSEEVSEEEISKEEISEEEPSEQEAFEEEVSKEPSKEPVKLAIPVYTAEELIAQAKAAGDEPEIIEDKEAGVTILDYSDIL